MGSIETIEIKCRRYDGGDGCDLLRVQAVVYGNWAAHPMAALDGPSTKRWSVTYVPAGLSVPSMSFEPWRAVAIAEDLSRNAKATFADPAKPSSSESAACKAIIEQWRSR